jgi:hypothetical protein
MNMVGCFSAFPQDLATAESVRFASSHLGGIIYAASGVYACVAHSKHGHMVLLIDSVFVCPITQHLSAQRSLLHGAEWRHRQHIPKVVALLCERLRSGVETFGATIVATAFLDVVWHACMHLRA